MKFIILLLFSVTQIHGQILVDTFPLPYNNINNSMWGITAFEDLLYLGEDFHGDIHIMTKDGSLNDFIDVDEVIDFNHGLSYDGLFFYVVEDYTTGGASVFKLDIEGEILESFILPPVNGGNSSGVGSLFKEGNTLWYTVYYPDFDEYPYNYAYQFDLVSKMIIDTIPLNGAQVYGFTLKDNEVIYVTDDLDGDEERIFVQDRNTDEILYSFPLEDPDGDSSPRGLHWDGNYLWLLANRPGPAAFAYKMVYQYELASISGPSYTTDTDTLDFGTIDVSQSNTRSLVVENTGTENLIITDASIPDQAFSLISNLPIIVTPGETGIMEFQFQPTEAIQYENTASISSNSVSSEKTIVLIGAGQMNSAISEEFVAKFTILPNPISGINLRLKAKDHHAGTIQGIHIYNLQGQLKLSETYPVDHMINIGELDNGIYILAIASSGNHKQLYKIVVHR